MIWVDTIAILISAYAFAYGLMRATVFLLPRVLPNPMSPLPLGSAATVSLIGFCMVTGTPGAAILAMIFSAIAITRAQFIGGSRTLEYAALLVGGLLIASLCITQKSLQIDAATPYVLAAIIAVALVVSLFLLAQAEAAHVPVLLLGSAASFALPPVLGAPYHVALDSAVMLACFGAFMHVRRHVRLPVTLDGAFTMPALIMMLHGFMVSAITLAKGL